MAKIRWRPRPHVCHFERSEKSRSLTFIRDDNPTFRGYDTASQGRRNTTVALPQASRLDRRPLRVPFRVLLIRVTRAQNCQLVEWLSYELQCDG